MNSTEPEPVKEISAAIDTRNCFEQMKPADLIALVVIIGGLTLISLHIDGIIGGLLVSVTAYYFGKQGRPPTANAE